MSTPALLDHLAALTDPVRCRILLLLEQDEAMVAELCTALQLPQSTVSRHLKLLLDEGWVTSRAASARPASVAWVTTTPSRTSL